MWGAVRRRRRLRARQSPPNLTNEQASGQEIAEAWFDLLALTGSDTGVTGAPAGAAQAGADLVRPYLDDTFQLQRASGERYTASDYVPVDIDAFDITDLRETAPTDDIRVLRFAVSTPGATTLDSGMVLSDVVAPRLAVARWDGDLGRWRIVSKANFNIPVQAVCDQTAVTMTTPQVPTSAEDQALGEDLARQWFDLLVAGDGSSLLNSGVQGQTASGAGYTGASEYTKGTLAAADLSDFVVTRNGNLLVVSLAVQAAGTVYADTTPLGATKTPRLLTFLQDEGGQWSLIATATFNPPATSPDGVECVPAS